MATLLVRCGCEIQHLNSQAHYARVAELVDAVDLKSISRKRVRVQVPPRAPNNSMQEGRAGQEESEFLGTNSNVFKAATLAGATTLSVVESSGARQCHRGVFPAVSQVARPSNKLNAMPVIAALSSPTTLAGTSRRTHWPVGGSGPM